MSNWVGLPASTREHDFPRSVCSRPQSAEYLQGELKKAYEQLVHLAYWDKGLDHWLEKRFDVAMAVRG